MLLLVCHQSYAQQTDTLSRFSQIVELDTFVMSSGFDANSFITRVRKDTTFYKAFKSYKLVPCTGVHHFTAFDKGGSVKATMQSKTSQVRSGNCRTTRVLEEQTKGDYYDKRGQMNYYTATMFAHLFFAKEAKCNESDRVAGTLGVKGQGQIEKSSYELKQLIFNPGSKVDGIPFMGAKAAVFEPDEAVKYDFKISREPFENTQCYKFSITPKPDYVNNVVFNELITWFRTSDYSIMARNYSLSYHTMLYDFDVKMKVRLVEINNKLYPASIDYDGNWHVFTKKRERVKFNSVMTY